MKDLTLALELCAFALATVLVRHVSTEKNLNTNLIRTMNTKSIPYRDTNAESSKLRKPESMRGARMLQYSRPIFPKWSPGWKPTTPSTAEPIGKCIAMQLASNIWRIYNISITLSYMKRMLYHEFTMNVGRISTENTLRAKRNLKILIKGESTFSRCSEFKRILHITCRWWKNQGKWVPRVFEIVRNPMGSV